MVCCIEYWILNSECVVDSWLLSGDGDGEVRIWNMGFGIGKWMKGALKYKIWQCGHRHWASAFWLSGEISIKGGEGCWNISINECTGTGSGSTGTGSNTTTSAFAFLVYLYWLSFDTAGLSGSRITLSGCERNLKLKKFLFGDISKVNWGWANMVWCSVVRKFKESGLWLLTSKSREVELKKKAF